jgi:hypothetical protein
MSVGGKRLHMLKLIGAFVLLAAVLMVAKSAYDIFVVVNKAIYAQMKPELVGQLFGWGIGAPYAFSTEDILGVLLGPIAAFLFWLAIAIVGVGIYQAGRVVLPIEEYEQNIGEHHRRLIEKAVKGARKRR